MKDRLDILIMAERIRARSASEKTPKRRPCPNPLLSPVSARAAEWRASSWSSQPGLQNRQLYPDGWKWPALM
jgi:hypothetical protein